MWTLLTHQPYVVTTHSTGYLQLVLTCIYSFVLWQCTIGCWI